MHPIEVEAAKLGIKLVPRERRNSWTLPDYPGWFVYDANRSDYPVGYEHHDDGRDYGQVETLERALEAICEDNAEKLPTSMYTVAVSSERCSSEYVEDTFEKALERAYLSFHQLTGRQPNEFEKYGLEMFGACYEKNALNQLVPGGWKIDIEEQKNQNQLSSLMSTLCNGIATNQLFVIDSSDNDNDSGDIFVDCPSTDQKFLVTVKEIED